MTTATLNYAANSQALTITVASLATDANLLAGRESTAVDNTTEKAIDNLVQGKVTTGANPTAGRIIEVWVYGSEDGTNYPDVIDGTDSNETITSADIKESGLRLATQILTDGTSNRTYPIAPFSVAALFGGMLPRRWGLFVVHSTGVNLNATASNHAFTYTPIKYDSVAA